MATNAANVIPVLPIPILKSILAPVVSPALEIASAFAAVSAPVVVAVPAVSAASVVVAAHMVARASAIIPVFPFVPALAVTSATIVAPAVVAALAVGPYFSEAMSMTVWLLFHAVVTVELLALFLPVIVGNMSHLARTLGFLLLRSLAGYGTSVGPELGIGAVEHHILTQRAFEFTVVERYFHRWF